MFHLRPFCVHFFRRFPGGEPSIGRTGFECSSRDSVPLLDAHAPRKVRIGFDYRLPEHHLRSAARSNQKKEK